MPGTGPPSRAVGEPGSAALSLPARARRTRVRCRSSRALGRWQGREWFKGRAQAGVTNSPQERLASTTRAPRSLTRNRVCRLLSELRPRPASLPQSSQTGQPPQTAECVGGPAKTRERAARCATSTPHHRGTWLTQRGLTPSLEDASTSLRDPLRRLRGRFIPFRRIPSRRQARHRSASTAPRRTRSARRDSSRRVLPKHTPHSAAPTPPYEGVGRLRTIAPVTMLVPVRLCLR